jgi:tRNA(Ile)-lysidine synthase
MKKKKKLSDYFIDSKFSRFDKEKVLVLESGGKIAWIVGERIDNRFRVTDSSRKIMIIKVKQKGTGDRRPVTGRITS